MADTVNSAEIRSDRPGSVGKPQRVEGDGHGTPTASHELAEKAIESTGSLAEKGAAQLQHNEVEVVDLGWNKSQESIAQPIVGGLSNEELWTLIRRFNKQIFGVRSISEPPLSNLDLNVAKDEEYSPDKLRAYLERFYMTVVYGLFSFVKHVARLRSWREKNRTAAFLVIYAVAWAIDYLVPVTLVFIMVLVLSPAFRAYCFPPVPPALIDAKTGGLKKPAAGVLGSGDSVTGAPETHSGEAVEQEAHNFVTGISSLAVSAAAGKHPQGDPEEEKLNEAAPDPTEFSSKVAGAKDRAAGDSPTVDRDKTKKPVENAIWDKARPAMYILANIVDVWERMGNALNPTPPFSQTRPRLVLAGAMVPLLLGSLFMTSYMLVKGTGFAVGFALFGDPLIRPTVRFVNKTYPAIKRYIELRHTVLRGVPTNAQLVLVFLRVGERNKAPLPPPPTDKAPPPAQAIASAHEDIEHPGVTDDEVDAAIHPDPDTVAEYESDNAHPHKKRGKLLSLFKGGTKGGLQTVLGADRLKARAGAAAAKNRLGAVVTHGANTAGGPVRFPARWMGRRGHATLTATATTPALSWTATAGDTSPAWAVAIGDITEVRKVGGLGWKSKIAVGWAMEREVADGIVVKDRMGKEWRLTAIPMRDELFNRLVAMGSQMWEAI